MITVRKQTVGIFVDRSVDGWIVRDPEGDFWVVPSSDGGWDARQPFTPTEETALVPVPGHYRYLLDLPF